MPTLCPFLPGSVDCHLGLPSGKSLQSPAPHGVGAFPVLPADLTLNHTQLSLSFLLRVPKREALSIKLRIPISQHTLGDIHAG